MFFDRWYDLIRLVVVGSLAYTGLVFLQRITGKRTLSKMNSFDFIVTVALGSALATALLSSEVTLAEGLMAFGLLMGLQYLVTWLSVRSQTISRMVKSEPRMLFYRGEFLRDAMRRERVVEEEILQAMRASGTASTQDVAAVVLETDGSFSVVEPAGDGPNVLENVRFPDG